MNARGGDFNPRKGYMPPPLATTRDGCPLSEEESANSDPIQAFVVKWMVYPLLVAIAAIFAVGVGAALIAPGLNYPRWVQAMVGIPALAGYYVVQLRPHFPMLFQWTSTRTDAQNASASEQGIAANLKGKGHTVVLNRDAPESSTWRRREDHRTSLVEKAIEPWIKEVDRLADYLSPHLLGKYAHAVPRSPGFAFRTTLGKETTFPDDEVIWDGAREHWPNLASRWSDFQDALVRLDDEALTLLDNLAKQLPKPPDTPWNYEVEDDPGFGANWAAAELWRLYWQYQEKRDGWRHFEEAARNQKWWRHEARQEARELGELARHFFFGEDNQSSLDAFQEEATHVLSILKDFKRELRAVTHNTNLTGLCEFCPKPE